ncbi:MAG: urea transporter [Nitrososphaerota archaeon]|nr:urea transporter [Nitrososphaerota archaeon]
MIPVGYGIIDYILDGVGQVFFMGSPLVGLIFLIGLWANSWKAATFAIIGSIAGGLVAFGLGIPVNTVYYGIYGFNAVLTAIALGDTFLEKGKAAYAIATFAAFATGFTTATGIWFAGIFGLPVETSAFVITTWVFLFAAYKLGGIKLASGGAPAKQRGALVKDQKKEGPIDMNEFTAWGFIKLIFTGIGQVMFQESWVTGVLFFIGLTLASVSLVPFAFGVQYPIYFAGITAFIASLIGTLTAILFKADRTSVLMGLYGFNAVLTSLAVMGVFLGFFWPIEGFAGSPINFLVMIFAVVLSSIVTGWIGSITSQWKLPTLTAPFVLTSWFVELAAHTFPSIAHLVNIIPLLIH